MIAGLYNIRLVIGSTFPAITLVCYNTSGPVDFTGYDWVKAEVRHATAGTVLLDLAPTFTDPSGGEITLSDFTDEETAVLEAGVHKWDIITSNAGAIGEPILAGAFEFATKITESS